MDNGFGTFSEDLAALDGGPGLQDSAAGFLRRLHLVDHRAEPLLESLFGLALIFLPLQLIYGLTFGI